jgi:hypothetical protein
LQTSVIQEQLHIHQASIFLVTQMALRVHSYLERRNLNVVRVSAYHWRANLRLVVLVALFADGWFEVPRRRLAHDRRSIQGQLDQEVCRDAYSVRAQKEEPDPAEDRVRALVARFPVVYHQERYIVSGRVYRRHTVHIMALEHLEDDARGGGEANENYEADQGVVGCLDLRCNHGPADLEVRLQHHVPSSLR